MLNIENYVTSDVKKVDILVCIAISNYMWLEKCEKQNDPFFLFPHFFCWLIPLHPNGGNTRLPRDNL